MRNPRVETSAKLLSVAGVCTALLGLGMLISLMFPGVRDNLANDVHGPSARPSAHPLIDGALIGFAFLATGAMVVGYARRLRGVEVLFDDAGLHIRNAYTRRDLPWDEIDTLGRDRLMGRWSPFFVRSRVGFRVWLEALGRGKEGSRLLEDLQAELDRRKGDGTTR